MGNSSVAPTQESYEKSNFKARWDEWDGIVQAAGGDVTDKMIIKYAGKAQAVTADEKDDDEQILARHELEDDALWHYGNNGHQAINAAIRDDKKGDLKKWMPKIWFITHFIDRNKDNFWPSPSCLDSGIAPGHKLLWRGSHLTAAQIAEIKPRTVYRLASLVSTSVDENVARTWRGDTIIKFLIPEGCRAAHIVGKTPQRNEKEVLLAAYTPVHVEGIADYAGPPQKRMIVMRVLPWGATEATRVAVRWAAGDDEGGARVGGAWADEDKGAPGQRVLDWLDEDLLLPCPDALCDEVYADHQRLVADNRALKKELRRIMKLIEQAAGLL